MKWGEMRCLVTGGAGFLGRRVVRKLHERGCAHVVVPRSRECDLRSAADTVRLLRESTPDLIIHLAGVVGGIGANLRRPGEFFYDNALMGIQLIELARRQGVQKFICVGTVCAYPKFAPAPFRESDLWNGYPEETNAPYGLAKKMLLVQLQAYRQQYDFHGIYLLPANLYGPEDNFDLQASHVIPALIRKFAEAKDRGDRAVEAWGTGNATREFLYVDDCAEGILLAAERYDKPDPVNLGTGEEIRIRDLATLIAGLVGFKGAVAWNASRPDGQPRRRLDVVRADQEFGFRAQVGLAEGLRRTVEWYATHARPAHGAREGN